MKAPSRNISESLRAQARRNTDGREPEMPEVSAQVMAKPSMIVPGDGGVCEQVEARQNPRSAAVYTGPMSRFGGR